MKTGLKTIRIKWKKANYVSKLNIIYTFYILLREKGMRKKNNNYIQKLLFLIWRELELKLTVRTITIAYKSCYYGFDDDYS